MERIRRDGAAGVGDLARDMGVSPVTIHRDLERLAAEGLIERVHGGAKLSETERAMRTAWATRRPRNAAAKAQIAQKALEWIEDDSTIFIDSSTTCAALATALAARPVRSLTLVTNSPAIAAELDHDGVHLIVAPGEVNQDLRMIGGRWTVEFLSELNFATAFVSALGLTAQAGLTTAQRAVADVLRAVRRVSARTIALVDSSKYGVRSLLPALAVDELDVLITDGDLPEVHRAELRDAGARLEIAGERAIRTS
jgi:DeoR family fructose operon transcriptional repressor